MLLGDLKRHAPVRKEANLAASQRTFPMLSIGSTVPCAYWQQEPDKDRMSFAARGRVLRYHELG